MVTNSTDRDTVVILIMLAVAVVSVALIVSSSCNARSAALLLLRMLSLVVPADVVSHLGNGNSSAGAKQLYDMMDRIRKARTGTEQQGKQVNPTKYSKIRNHLFNITDELMNMDFNSEKNSLIPNNLEETVTEKVTETITDPDSLTSIIMGGLAAVGAVKALPKLVDLLGDETGDITIDSLKKALSKKDVKEEVNLQDLEEGIDYDKDEMERKGFDLYPGGRSEAWRYATEELGIPADEILGKLSDDTVYDAIYHSMQIKRKNLRFTKIRWRMGKHERTCCHYRFC